MNKAYVDDELISALSSFLVRESPLDTEDATMVATKIKNWMKTQAPKLLTNIHPLIVDMIKVRDERNQTYNQDEGQLKSDGFTDIGDMWAAILRNTNLDGGQLTGHTVCLMMAALKLWRAARAPFLEDSYIDAMNYVVLAKECLDAQVRDSS